MMGKRVDYACRSVISPDPNIDNHQVGLPMVFAIKLTVQEYVNSHNIDRLRQAVINGPNKHPGATHVITDGKEKRLSPHDQVQREAESKQLATNDEELDRTPSIVRRHVMDGDMMLLNRQPTLHKGSMMAHEVRVLQHEKTLRLHYANCKSYNADFDGDEMNAHLPQCVMSRAEAVELMQTNKQYLSAKDGKPLSGLMQDHIVSAVHMCCKDRTFTKEEYHRLVYSGLSKMEGRIKLLPPTYWKPEKLWTGKQLISTLLINICPSDTPLNLEGNTKIKPKLWIKGKPRPARCAELEKDKQHLMDESTVIIRQGELMSGTPDKNHYGASQYGIVHQVYEQYGGKYSGMLLSSLGRMFTDYLQYYRGFTLGVADIKTTKEADKKRQELIEESLTMGLKEAAEALDVKSLDENQVEEAYQEAHLEQLNPKQDTVKMGALDHAVKKVTSDISNKIQNCCSGVGLIKSFPANNLQLMVNSGAKGSDVNCNQISGLLGQIELEGKRPPLMPSGKSLPSFKAYDTSLWARGFITQRFLTGVHPQNYYVHCMAGREGLIDTAVKTSRSGYLQRQLMKGLEGLTVKYDNTVRDSDGSVIQFLYGEDGLDVTKASYLKYDQSDKNQTKYLIENHLAIAEKDGGYKTIDNIEEDRKVAKSFRKLDKNKKRVAKNAKGRISPFLMFCNEKENRGLDKDQLVTNFRKLSKKELDEYKEKVDKIKLMDPVNHKHKIDKMGSVSEKFHKDLTKLHEHPQVKNKLPTKEAKKKDQLNMERLQKLAMLKYQRCAVDAGENVGVLAAQSVGEPSTQMTLNTFHFAGRGEMNVTLGIPRLNEILMVATNNIKTPFFSFPVNVNYPDGVNKIKNMSERKEVKAAAVDAAEKSAERISKKLNKVLLKDVLQAIIVETCESDHSLDYKIRFYILEKKHLKADLGLKPQHIIQKLEEKVGKKASFYKQLLVAIGSALRTLIEKRDMDECHYSKKQPNHAKEKKSDDDEDDEKSDNENDESDDENEDDDDESEDSDKEEGSSDAENNSDDEDDDDVEEEKKQEIKERYDAVKRLVHSIKSKKSDHGYGAVGVTGYKCKESDNGAYAEVKISTPVHPIKINIEQVVKRVVEKTTVRQILGINRAFVEITKAKSVEENPKVHLKIEATNLGKKNHLEELFMKVIMSDKNGLLDLTDVYTNCVHSMRRLYGIDAGKSVIVNEITSVFSVYKIEVNNRHLSLISDFMCHSGQYQAFSRQQSMKLSTSPFQQMSFETTTAFMRDAVMHGHFEANEGPSSRIITGKPVNSGTGMFDLLETLDFS